MHGQRPLILDLKANDEDDDHVVALFTYKNHWGAISKTNHATLRFREPVYKTIRELALSYFHEYTTPKGNKVMVSFSRLFSLLRYHSFEWITSEKDLWYIPRDLDCSPHIKIIPHGLRLRPADPIEIDAGELRQWQ